MQGNVVTLFVGGHEVSLDHDLFFEQSFEAVTSRGNRYLVERYDDGSRALVWQVTQIAKPVESLHEHVGRVTGWTSLFRRRPTSFQFVKDHSPVDSGSQSNLLNAVQSLTD